MTVCARGAESVRTAMRALIAAPVCALAGCNLVANLGEFDNAVGATVDAAPDRESVIEPVAEANEAGAPGDSIVGNEDGGESMDTGVDPPGTAPVAAADVIGVDTDDAMLLADDAAPQGMNVGDTADAASGAADAASGATDAASGATDAASGAADAASGAADAGEPADPSDGGTWCATHVSSITVDCHDFDEGRSASAGFTSNYFSSVFANVTMAAFAPGSAPSALLITTPLLATGANAAFEQFNDTVSFHDKIELSFALKIANYDSAAPDVSLFRVSYEDNSWAESLDFQQVAANFIETASPPDGGSYRGTHTAAQPSTVTDWTNVDVLYDFVGHTVTLSYNGIAVVTDQAIQNLSAGTPSIFVQVGLNFLQAPAQSMMIYYDNILLQTPP
jgi:hypothetical protein